MKKLFIALMMMVCHTALWAQVIIPTPREMNVDRAEKVSLTSTRERIDRHAKLPDEGYTLRIRDGKAVLTSKTEQGMVWARQTLAQLRDEEGLYPQVTIRDWPAFAIRGFMHDTGRNYRPVELLKKDLDLFSFYKLNVFHWHLTDNPGWRIESKAYPQLNAPENMKKGRNEGTFYTYDEIRDVISYARERGITVIPEIDMPGHSEYFKKTFGFTMASAEGMKVLEDCLREFFEEIPRDLCPYMHIGSDEVKVDNPEEFIAFLEKLVTSDGRTPIVWAPGLKASPTTISQVWAVEIGRDMEKKPYDVPFIDSYNGYLNNGNVIWNVTQQLLHTFCTTDKGNDLCLGSIKCLWNDLRLDDKSLLMPFNGCPAAVASFAEGIWQGGKNMPINDTSLMPAKGSPYDLRIADWERRFSYHRDHFLTDWDTRWVANSQMTWRVALPERRGADPDKMTWVEARGGCLNMGAIARKNNVKLTNSMDAWAETKLYAERDTVIRAIVGFDSACRSNRISSGIGEQGYWEADGRLFVGDVEVFPPVPWKEPGKYNYPHNAWSDPYSEMPYTLEQLFWMREPAYLPLKAGWNTIRLYCPRLLNWRDWYVTFLPVTLSPDGRLSEAQGIRCYD